ncbi:MAG: hypothetical protein WC781_03200 [Candidatus Pacearchaeota archaeon]|jgi:hypothetical protein
MKVLNFTFNKISIVKKKEINKPISINTDILIKDIKKQTLAVLEGQDIYIFEYDFVLNYEDYADVLINGYVILMTESSELSANIEELWKSKNIPNDIKLYLFNYIFSRCHLKALQLEQDIDIPPHIAPPFFSAKPEESDNSLDSKKSQKSKK